MAKKKRDSKKDGKKPQGGSKGKGGTSPMPDWRTIESIMRKHLPELGFDAPDEDETPLDKAQELIYEALEAPPGKQAALAKKALDLSPDCADAYVLLAEAADSTDEALILYEKGVAAGERALGKEFFKQNIGHFWLMLETRPYMRARMGLGDTLWALNRRDEAISNYQEMLRLNPNDNQGVRDILAAWLLEMNRDTELESLLEAYKDDATAAWAYTRALSAFRKEGDTPASSRLLKAAKKSNKYVPPLITGHKQLPREMPPYITLGHEDEAVAYAMEHMGAWRSTPGALAWMRKVAKLSSFPTQKPARAPSRTLMRRVLAELPQVAGEVWQVDVQPVTNDNQESENVDVWLFLLIDCTTETPLVSDMLEDEPSPRRVWDKLVEAMRRPTAEDAEPHRPEEIQVRDPEWADAWRADLKAAGIRCVVEDELEQVDAMLDSMAESISEMSERARAEVSLDPQAFRDISQETDETWQVDVAAWPAWIEIAGQLQRPWILLVTSATHDGVLANDLSADAPTSDDVWGKIALAIQSPLMGEPHRPGTVEVRSPELHAALQPRLEEIGIQCERRDALDHIDFVLQHMADHMGAKETMAAQIDVPGMTPRQLGGFFEAAASFYQRAPWRDVPGDTPLRIVCRKFDSSHWYGVVMGQSGMTFGLAMYEDLNQLYQMIDDEVSDEEHFRHTSGISFTYGEEFQISTRDLDAAKKYGWPVVSPEAYPSALRLNPGGNLRPLLTWELELLEGALRALPLHLSQHDKQPKQYKVPAASGELELEISWTSREDKV